MIPSIVNDPGRSRLSLAEREEIACLRAANLGVRAIARQLGRAPSTISRELARRPAGRGGYRASTAQAEADRLARRPKPARLACELALRREVQDRLKLNNSPEQIARRLRVDFPDDPEMRVSHETIYQALYVQGRGALRRELHHTPAHRPGAAQAAPRAPASAGAGSRAWSTSANGQPRSTTGPCPGTGRAT